VTALLTIKDVAHALGVKERTLRDVVARLGYRCPEGRGKLYFSAYQVEQIKGALQCRSKFTRRVKAGRKTVASGGRTLESMWTEAQELLSEPSPSKPSRSSNAKLNVVNFPKLAP